MMIDYMISHEKATQEEVDKATRELKNKAFVIESMPKAEKKEADNNQDSRNGSRDKINALYCT